MVYEVPYYIIGFPVYDMKTCLTFLIMTLRKKGMFVKYKSPNILFIHWGAMIQKNYQKMLKDNNYYIGDKFQELQKVKPQTNKNIQQINNNLVKDFKSNEEDRNIDRLIEMSKYLD